MPNIIKRVTTKRLLDNLENGVQSNKTYARIAKEQGMHHRKVSKLLKSRSRMTREEFIEAREKRVAIMILTEIRPVDISRKLGISRQLVNYIKHNIVWDKYEEYNKLGLKV